MCDTAHFHADPMPSKDKGELVDTDTDVLKEGNLKG